MSALLKKRIVWGVVAVAVLVFVATFVQAFLFIPDSGTQPPAVLSTAKAAVASATIPVGPAENPSRLAIPSLSIDAHVQYVGVTKTGSLGVPNNFTDVAWYKYGTVPGQVGSAVIDGHVDNAVSLPGVFKHLSSIKVGDDVYVQTVNGTKLHFIVTGVESYPYKDLPLQRIFNTSGGAYLNLITCGGTWIQSQRSYDQRLVVYTKFVPS